MKTNLNMKNWWLLACCAFAVTMSSTHAAIITWEAPQRINLIGDTIVRTEGTLMEAIDSGRNNLGTVRAVNGVDFVTAIPLGDTVTIGGSHASAPVYNNNGVGVSFPFHVMLDAFAFQNPSGSWNTTGLAIGNTYLVQVFTSDMRAGAERFIEFSDGGVGGSDRVTQKQGYSHVGSFVADATSQTFTMYGFTTIGGLIPNTAGVVNGYQLRETNVIPEPSSLALAGLLALVMCGYMMKTSRRDGSCANAVAKTSRTGQTQ